MLQKGQDGQSHFPVGLSGEGPEQSGTLQEEEAVVFPETRGPYSSHGLFPFPCQPLPAGPESTQ